MKDYDKFDSTDPSATEVELSAQDLLDMSPPAAMPAIPAAAVPVSSVVVARSQAESRKPASSGPVRAHTTQSRRLLRHATRIAWACGFVVIVASAVALTDPFSPPDRPHRIAMQSSVPQKPQPVVENEAAPTLVTNPFDETEVFELPPGTSETEARDYVANLLLQRAAERQAVVDARSLRR